MLERSPLDVHVVDWKEAMELMNDIVVHLAMLAGGAQSSLPVDV